MFKAGEFWSDSEKDIQIFGYGDLLFVTSHPSERGHTFTPTNSVSTH